MSIYSRILRTPGGACGPAASLVLDAYGGPGAQRPGVQTRPADGFTYQWEQCSFDPVTHRTTCRIHFVLDDGTPQRNAFRYDWRLWTLPEFSALLGRAGYSQIDIWSQNPRGKITPTKKMPAQENWTVYLAARASLPPPFLSPAASPHHHHPCLILQSAAPQNDCFSPGPDVHW